jgi:hypothetical protein
MTGITPDGHRRATNTEVQMVRAAARKARDQEMAALCDRALAGSLAAWDEVSDALHEARFGQYRPPPTWGPGDTAEPAEPPYWQDQVAPYPTPWQ